MIKDSTKDQAEIEKFNNIAHSWQDNNGAFKILHEINPLRVDYIISKISKHFKIDITNNNKENFQNLTAVDIGCGGGLASVALSKFGLNITGIDAASNNIEQAKFYAHSLNKNVKFIYGEINDLVTEKLQYDIIICLEVIEHVNNLEIFFEGIAQILKPGGMIIISTINRTLKAFLLAIVAGEYILRWVPINTHSYKKFIKPSEVQNFLNKRNLYIKELRGLNYDLINKTWRLSDDIDVNYFAYIK